MREVDSMFKTGDTVFYPEHGVGVIDKIEEKEINGEKKSYYKFHLINNPMKILLPLDKVANLHIRYISDTETVDCILKDISNKLADFSEISHYNYKDRREKFLRKIKMGTMENYLEVIYLLTKLKVRQDLNLSEGQILYRSKKIVIEEISIAKNVSKDEAANLLEYAISS